MIKGRLFLFNEAPGDDVDETIAEPTEDDAKFKSDEEKSDVKTTNTDSTSSNDTEKDDTETEEDLGDETEPDPLGDDLGDEGMGGEEVVDPAVGANPEEKAKKSRLLKDYKTLLSVTEELKETFSRADMSKSSDKEKAMFLELDKMINDNLGKLEYSMTVGFTRMKYERLLTVYTYVKTSIKAISEILQILVKL